MAKASKLDHARHNYDVCNFLSPNTNYADWVIITAFYSAIHYVDHKIFPLKISEQNGNKFKISCIDEYRNVFPKQADKHSRRAELVAERLNEISASFNWLRSMGHTARYSNYTYNNPGKMLKTAKDHLDIISVFCSL